MMNLTMALRASLALVAIGVLAVAWALVSKPTVSPNPPPENLFTVADSSAGMTTLDSLDFVFRPLFSRDRRPTEDVAVDPTSESNTESVWESRLEGISLIGVFASGEAQGVILRRDSGEKLRLVEGDEMDGWQLQSVESRAAVFTSGSGAGLVEDRIEMGVISSLPVPETVAPQSAKPNPEAQQAPQPLTFDSIDRQRAAAMEARDSDKDNKQ